MRLKTFTAPTVAQALQKVRAELGEDAIILSTESGRGGARLVAALEVAEHDGDGEAVAAEAYEGADEAPPSPGAARDDLRAALLWHGIPAPLGERLLRSALLPEPREKAVSLAAALDAALSFQPLTDRLSGRPIMLVGPAGVGKTLIAAKLIVDAHRRGRPVAAASCDTLRAGGIEQLEAFTRILGLPLSRVEQTADLASLAAAAAAGSAAIVDTAGCCPFSGEEMQALEEQIEAAEAEPVLVVAAGGDANEAAETAAAFARIGCRRMIATRIDVSRRLGGLVAAAAGGRLAIAGAGIGPHAAEPLAPVNALSLAKLLLSAAAVTSSGSTLAPVPTAAPAADPRKAR